MSEGKTSETDAPKSKTSEAMKNIVILLASPILTFAGAYLAVRANLNIEAEKTRLATAESITKLMSSLISDNPREREVAYGALRAIGVDSLAEDLRVKSLFPERLRIYVKDDHQKKAVGYLADYLLTHHSAIYIAPNVTKFPPNVEVRYFDEKDWKIANHVASLMNRTLSDKSATVRRGPPNTETKGAIEVWLPKGHGEPDYSGDWGNSWTVDTYTYGSTYEPGLISGFISTVFCKQ